MMSTGIMRAHTTPRTVNMSKLLDLIALLQVERLELNLFRGSSADIGSRNVFGGQVLGQALMAASQTVEGRAVHSLHAYFLRPGDKTAPIVYDVERSRDGTSFTTRRVVAIQHGRPIFNTTVSFQIDEQGADHQDPMPQVPGPEGLATEQELMRLLDSRLPGGIPEVFLHDRALEFRPVDAVVSLQGQRGEPLYKAWVKASGSLPDDPVLHRAVLAYASDYHLLLAAMQRHGYTFLQKDLHIASLDHAMWFHRPFRADEWLLYAIDSPSASGARGLCRGQFFTRDGSLVASTVQEGLLRKTVKS